MTCAETISAHRLYHGQVLRIVWVETDGSVHAALGQYYLTDRPTTSQLHSAISPRDTAECFETSSAPALPSLFDTAKAVVKSFIG